jgi:hypothetical protein
MKTMARIVIGIVVGGALGFANYKFIGCRTGTCPLSSNPWVSTVVGMVLGGSIGGTFQ